MCFVRPSRRLITPTQKPRTLLAWMLLTKHYDNWAWETGRGQSSVCRRLPVLYKGKGRERPRDRKQHTRREPAESRQRSLTLLLFSASNNGLLSLEDVKASKHYIGILCSPCYPDCLGFDLALMIASSPCNIILSATSRIET